MPICIMPINALALSLMQSLLDPAADPWIQHALDHLLAKPVRRRPVCIRPMRKQPP